MTSNSNLKQQARAYAAERGVSYTQARREILAATTTPPESVAGAAVEGFVSRRMVTIQQAERADGVLPLPFHLDEHGFVDRQDFWRGSPLRLVGFVGSPDSKNITVEADEFVADPTSAVGMHPVLADRDGRFTTYVGVVESVEEFTDKVATPEAVAARVRTSDGRFDLTVGVGHLMWLLNKGDFTGQVRDGNIKPESKESMLGWLMVDPGGQDINPLHALYSHVEAILDRIDDGTGDERGSGGLVQVDLDAAGVSQWLSSRNVA